jgi:hypothetical protein
MSYKLRREVEQGKVVGLSLGVPYADAEVREPPTRAAGSAFLKEDYYRLNKTNYQLSGLYR